MAWEAFAGDLASGASRRLDEHVRILGCVRIASRAALGMGGTVTDEIDQPGVIHMSDGEKSPEERGREAADALMAGAEHVVGESLRSLWWLARWGCIVYVVYFVLAFVAGFILFAIADLRLPWWAWVGLALLVGYMVNRRKA